MQTKEPIHWWLMQRLKRRYITLEQNRAVLFIIPISTCVQKWVMGTLRTVSLVWPGRQERSILRTGHQGNINDPVWQPHWGSRNRKLRWMGGKWEWEIERGKRTEWEISRGRQRDMEECSYSSKPEAPRSAKSAPLPPRLNHKPKDSSGWLASGLNRHKEERNVWVFCSLIDDPQTLIWSVIWRNALKQDNIRNG